MFRPHCVHGYDDAVHPVFGEIPAPGMVVETGEGHCDFFDAEDPQTLRVTVAEGDELDIDLVVQNQGKQAINAVRAWINYDPNTLEATEVTINKSNFPEVTPGEEDISSNEGYIKIGARAESGNEPEKYWVPVARIKFRVKKTNTTGTVLSFFNVQRGGNTSITTNDDGEDAYILGQEPGSLLVKFGEGSSNAGNTGTQNDSDAGSDGGNDPETIKGVDGAICADDDECQSGNCVDGTCQPVGSPLGSEGDACNEDSECSSSICYEDTCRSSGFKIPDGGSCRRDNQCLSLTCEDGRCKGIVNLPDGSGCSADAECASEYCEDGFCATPNVAGENASNDDGSGDGGDRSDEEEDCRDTRTCDIGDRCKRDKECRSGNCDDGICKEREERKVEDGGECRNSRECESGACLDGTCRSKDDIRAQRTAFVLLQIRNLRVTTEGSSVFLAWDELPSSLLDSYNIYYSTTSGQYIQRKNVPKQTANVAIRNLPVDTQYYFAVRGVSKTEEESAFSPEVSVVVSKPDTSTNPLTASMLTPPTTNPIKNPGGGSGSESGGGESNNGEQVIPGETGVPPYLLMLMLASAVIGTFLAARRQLHISPAQSSDE